MDEKKYIEAIKRKCNLYTTLIKDKIFAIKDAKNPDEFFTVLDLMKEYDAERGNRCEKKIIYKRIFFDKIDA